MFRLLLPTIIREPQGYLCVLYLWCKWHGDSMSFHEPDVSGYVMTGPPLVYQNLQVYCMAYFLGELLGIVKCPLGMWQNSYTWSRLTRRRMKTGSKYSYFSTFRFSPSSRTASVSSKSPQAGPTCFSGKSTFVYGDGVEHYWSDSDWGKPK